MKIDVDKLKRLKVLHLSYLTEAQREAAEVTEEGFTLHGMLIEAIPDMESKVGPDAKEYPVEKLGDGVTKTTLPDNSVVLEIPIDAPKKKRVTKETFKTASPVKEEVKVEPKKKSSRKKKA